MYVHRCDSRCFLMDVLNIPAVNNSAQSATAQVSTMEIRRQMTEAVHMPAVVLPENYTMSASVEKKHLAPALSLPAQGLRTLAQALLLPASMPNAKLLALKCKAQEWFG